ncbi:unnamed protein product [Arabidopsis halleri]
MVFLITAEETDQSLCRNQNINFKTQIMGNFKSNSAVVQGVCDALY